MLEHIFKLENRIMLNAVSPVPEILVISEGVDDYADLAAAANDNVEVITYNPDTDNLTDLLQDIQEAADGGSIDGVSFATHGDANGGIRLTAEETVTADSLNTDAEQQAFFNGLANLMAENGRIDFLACSVSDAVETSIESFVGKGINVAISNDITGASGDWILESDGIDLTGANGYFDADALKAFTSSLHTTTTVTASNMSGDITTLTYIDADAFSDAIEIDLSADPNASRVVTFATGDIVISSSNGDLPGTLSFYAGKPNLGAGVTAWDKTGDASAVFTGGPYGTFDLVGVAGDGKVKIDLASIVKTESMNMSDMTSIVDGATYTAPAAGGIYAIFVSFDSGDDFDTPDRDAIFFVEVIPYVAPKPDFKEPEYIPLDILAPDTLAADLTNMQLNYNPLDILGPELPIVEPLEIYQGTEFASIEVASLVSISERDMDSSRFADGGTPAPSKIASAINYDELSMGVPDFLTQPEIDSVIYLNNYQEVTKVYSEPTAADIAKLGYYPAAWEATDADGSGYYIKIEDNIYYINLKSPVECCGTRVADFDADGDNAEETAPIENDFISRHLEHLKKTGKGIFNNFKKVARY